MFLYQNGSQSQTLNIKGDHGNPLVISGLSGQIILHICDYELYNTSKIGRNMVQTKGRTTGHVAINMGHAVINKGHVAIDIGHVAINIGHVAIGHFAINVGHVAIMVQSTWDMLQSI